MNYVNKSWKPQGSFRVIGGVSPQLLQDFYAVKHAGISKSQGRFG